MLKKRIAAVILCFMLVVGSLPMPFAQDSVKVKAEELTDSLTDPAILKESSSPVKSEEAVSENHDKSNAAALNEYESFGRKNSRRPLPSDDIDKKVDPSLSIDEAKKMRVDKNTFSVRKGRITDEEYAQPSAYPYSSDKIRELNDYFNTELPPLRDQGAYGTCWAYATICAVESYLMHNEGSKDLHGDISRNNKYNSDHTPILPGLNYSELQLAYFTYHSNTNPIIDDQMDSITGSLTKESFLDYGGNEYLGARALMNWRGAVDESAVPYRNADEFTTPDEINAVTGMPEEYAYRNDIAHVSNAYFIDIRENADQVKQAIKENGAVSVGYHDDDRFYSDEYNSYYNYRNVYSNHAVCIVGWDDSFSKDKFENKLGKKPENNGAWLIRNSWMDSLKNPDAEKLSRNGYFWISYEDTSLSDVMVLEVESADNYDNNYYYTNQISDETSDDEFDTVANVFEINGLAGAEKETVSAVGLVTYDTYVDYSIAVYAVDEDGKPDISRKLSKQDTEGTLCFAGIYTIPLNDPVTLSKGDKFAVVVKTGRAGDVAIEYGMEYGDFDIKVYANQGESFCLTGSGWEDYSTYLEDSPEGLVGNFLIQAFTTDEEDPELCNSITGLKCTDRGETSITIEWDGLGDGVKYDIYRAFDSFREEFTLIKSDYNGTVYTDNNLPLCSKCFYKVVPVVKYVPQTELSSMIIGVETVPVDGAVDSGEIITDVFYKVDGNYTCVFSAIGDAADYNIEYRPVKSDDWIPLDDEQLDVLYVGKYGFVWTLFDLTIDPGRYYFRDKYEFVNLFGEEYSGKIYETPSYAVSFYPAPENIEAEYEPEDNSVTLTWEAGKINGNSVSIDGYDVFFEDADKNLIKVNDAVVTGTAITITNVPKDQELTYYIYVHDNDFGNEMNNLYSYRGYVDVETYSRKMPVIDDFVLILDGDIDLVFPSDEVLSPDGERAVTPYNGKPHTVEVSHPGIPDEQIGTCTVVYNIYGYEKWIADPPAEALIYNVGLKISGGTEYRPVTLLTDDLWCFEISALELIVTPDDDCLSKTEGEKDPVFEYTWKGNLNGEIPKFIGALSRQAGEEPGEYKITLGTLDLDENDNFSYINYDLVLDEKYFTINPLDVELTAPTVTAENITNISAELSWNAVEYAKKYVIYNGDEKIGETIRTGCVVEDLTPGETYTFYVYPVRYSLDENIKGCIQVTTLGRMSLTASDFEYDAPDEIKYDGDPWPVGEMYLVPVADVEISDIYYKRADSDELLSEAVDAGEYTVVIDTYETIDYLAAEKLTDASWIFTILPTDEKISNTPSDAKIVAFSTDSVNKVELPENWEWSAKDADKTLPVGTVITAIADYVGADRQNYKNNSVVISIIRSLCEHEHTEVINAKASTCSETGYTGDVYCNDCEQVLEKGNEVPLLAHTYGKADYIWNSDRTKCIAEAVCTAEGCGYKITEEAVISSEVLTVELGGEETQITRFTAVFKNTDAFETQIIDVEGVIENTPDDENGNESGSGEDTGNESGSGEETGNESGSGEESGSDTNSGEETGNESGNGEESGSGTNSGEVSGNGSGSGEETGNGSGSSDSDSNGETDSDAGSNGGSGSSSGSGSSGGSGYAPVIVNPSDNTNNGTTGGTSTSDTDDKSDKSGDKDNIGTGDTTVTGNTTGNTDGTTSNSDKTITKTTKDNEGNTEKYIYTIKKASEGTKKADQGIVALKKISGDSVNLTISGIIKQSGKKYVVEAIAKKILYKNRSIETLVIGSNIKTIGSRAFAYDSKLNTVWILSTKLETIGKYAFMKIASDADIYIVTGKKKTFNRIKKLIEDSGIGKNVNIEQKSKKAYNTWKASLSNS